MSVVIATDGTYSVTLPTSLNSSHWISLKMDDFIGAYVDNVGVAGTSIYGYTYDWSWEYGTDGGLNNVYIYLNSTPQ